MTNEIRIAVLGLEHDHVWGNLDELMATPGAKLVAVSDRNEPLMQKAREKYSCATYQEPEKLLESEELDGVMLFSDNNSNVSLAQMAAAYGLHVMIEKPMADSLAGADLALASLRSAGKLLMVNWPVAWSPRMQHLVHLVRSGAIGDIWQTKYRAAHAGPRELGCSEYFCQWLYDTELNGGGAIIDYGCYGALLASLLLGLPSRVSAMSGRLRKEDILVDDNAVILMRYPQAISIAEASWTQIGNLTAYHTVVYGSQGVLMLTAGSDAQLLLATADEPQGKPVEVPQPPAHLLSASANFVEAIRSGVPLNPICDARVGRDAQEILEAALLSAESGREVPLPLRGVY